MFFLSFTVLFQIWEIMMGLLDFAADIGHKLFGSEDEGGEKIKEHIEESNPGVENLEVEVKDGVAHIKGEAKDQSAFQKAVLMAGNIFGISEVQAAELKAPEGDEDVLYYEVKKGDSLWKIAANTLGNGTKHTEIFEANREVIRDPDLIFPGQKLRIPGGKA